jgi:hypothetical protein
MDEDFSSLCKNVNNFSLNPFFASYTFKINTEISIFASYRVGFMYEGNRLLCADNNAVLVVVNPNRNHIFLDFTPVPMLPDQPFSAILIMDLGGATYFGSLTVSSIRKLNNTLY